MAATFTFTKGPGSGDKCVVQRDTATHSTRTPFEATVVDIPEDVTYEARVVQDGTSTEVVTWTVLETRRSGSTVYCNFPASIALGGWYNWDVRVRGRDGTITNTFSSYTAKWGVGLNFLLIGQSNFELFWQKSSSPATPDAKTGHYSHTNGGSTYSADQTVDTWIDPTAHTVGNGITQFANQMQAKLTSAIADHPVGVIGLAIGATATTQQADYLGVGHWSDEPGRTYDTTGAPIAVNDIFSTMLARFDNATAGKRSIEGICYHQGEAEATVLTVDSGTPASYLQRGDYKEALIRVIYRLRNAFSGVAGASPNITIGQPADLFSGYATSLFLTNQNPVGDGLDLAFEEDLGYLFCRDFQVTNEAVTASNDNVAADYGLHWTTTGQTSAANRLANIVAAQIGWAGSKRGPYISSCRIGSTTSTTDRNSVVVGITHDQGTDLATLHAEVAQLFQVVDRYGPLAVTAVAKTNATTLTLTVARTSDSTAVSAGYPLAPQSIVGNHIAVGYCNHWAYCQTFSSGGHPLILDNATTAMPLLPGWTWYDSTEDVAHTTLRNYGSAPLHQNDPALTVYVATVASVDAVGDLTLITTNALSSWVQRNGRLPVPGIMVDVFDATGATWLGSFEVEGITSYTDDSTGITFEVTHKWNNQSASSPTRRPAATNLLVFYPVPYVGQSIMGSGPYPSSYKSMTGAKRFAERNGIAFYTSGNATNNVTVIKNHGTNRVVVNAYDIADGGADSCEIGFMHPSSGFYQQIDTTTGTKTVTDVRIVGPAGWDLIAKAAMATPADGTIATAYVEGEMQ